MTSGCNIGTSLLMMSRAVFAVSVCLALASVPDNAGAFPLTGDQSVLPPGTELIEDALYRPTEVFHSEARGGFKSYQVDLGDLAFNSPNLLGGPARRAGMSCGTCHVNGAGNARLYVPGMSTRPGNFDTTGPLFNPKAHNGVLDPVRVPSLRGARFLAPYGHNRQTTTQHQKNHNDNNNKNTNNKPTPTKLDALV